MSPASAPDPSGISRAPSVSGLEAIEIALEHPEVGEQVVAEVDRLGALQVRVTGHAPIGMRLGQFDQLLHQRAEQAHRPLTAVADVEREVGRHLVVAGTPGVELAPHRPRNLGDPALDRHVYVLVVVEHLEAPFAKLDLDFIEGAQQLCQLLVGEHPSRPQGTCVRPRLPHVVRPEHHVEANRGVDAPKDRML